MTHRSTRPGRGAVAVVLLVGISSLVGGCTSAEDKFCGRLRAEHSLGGLLDAIADKDQRRITESLRTLRELQDLAPKEIFADFRLLIDISEAVVREMLPAPDADGERSSVNFDRLNQLIAKSVAPAQHVASYAEENCGLKLSS